MMTLTVDLHFQIINGLSNVYYNIEERSADVTTIDSVKGDGGDMLGLGVTAKILASYAALG